MIRESEIKERLAPKVKERLAPEVTAGLLVLMVAVAIALFSAGIGYLIGRITARFA